MRCDAGEGAGAPFTRCEITRKCEGTTAGCRSTITKCEMTEQLRVTTASRPVRRAAVRPFRPARHPLPSPLLPPAPPFRHPALPFYPAFGPHSPPHPARRALPPAGEGIFDARLRKLLAFSPRFFRVLAPEFCRQIPPFPVILHPVSRNLAPLLARCASRHGADAGTRPDGGASSWNDGEESRRRGGRGTEAMRRDADEGADATATKCEITGNASSHDGGGDGATSPPSPARPASQFPPRCSRLASFSPPVPPLLSDFWPSSPLRPDRRALPPAGGGIFRARLRKLLAFSPHFSVLSHPIFAAKSPCFP